MLKDKVALITGASRGIGRAIALKMSQNGAKIAAVYAGNDKSANITKEMIENAGGVCNIYKCDISNFEETKKLIENIKTDFT
ncbi:MAG: SDR family NAD(P)-dependent oxidoreductase, partial [Oscillospiraceae bacterium]